MNEKISIKEHNLMLLEYMTQNKQLMERVEVLEEKLKDRDSAIGIGIHVSNLMKKQNKRYREAMKEILDNKISCWEVIENKLNYALYKE